MKKFTSKPGSSLANKYETMGPTEEYKVRETRVDKKGIRTIAP